MNTLHDLPTVDTHLTCKLNKLSMLIVFIMLPKCGNIKVHTQALQYEKDAFCASMPKDITSLVRYSVHTRMHTRTYLYIYTHPAQHNTGERMRTGPAARAARDRIRRMTRKVV